MGWKVNWMVKEGIIDDAGNEWNWLNIIESRKRDI